MLCAFIMKADGSSILFASGLVPYASVWKKDEGGSGLTKVSDGKVDMHRKVNEVRVELERQMTERQEYDGLAQW